MAVVDVEQDRFAFGENWARFLSVLDEDRIAEAQRSLIEAVGREEIADRRWLDIGSGSGLFSLAAARLGAASLHSFDFDADSVQCTRELRRREGVSESRWVVERGSVLDAGYMQSLETFDLVYSWGVLHHTGDLWTAFDRAAEAVAPGGVLFIAIYNDQGSRSRVWTSIKRCYNRLPSWLRLPYTLAIMGPRELLSLAKETAHLRPDRYVRGWTQYRSTRGMSRWHDIVDWIGGYPFEVATPEAVLDRGRRHGLVLEHLITRQGLGCNQFVFRRPARA
jgi:2-polyprenyl-6-hydroxyphenyl methylase/3-demethylubiquinone-9 3-methyltransferase